MKDDRLVVVINKLFHDLTAHLYDRQHPEIFQLEEKGILGLAQLLKVDNLGRVVDVGSGTGFIYRTLKGRLRFDGFFMVDISLSMLKVCKDNFPETYYIKSSALNLPFKDKVFDTVFINSVLHHMPNIDACLKEIHRIVKPGGKVIINHEPNARFSHNAFLWYQHNYKQGVNKNGFDKKTP